MAKNTLPDFTPELRVLPRVGSSRLVVLFDTATDLDLKRSPRVVMVDTEGVTSLTTSVDEIVIEDAVTHHYVTGKINLLAQREEGDVRKYLLSEFRLQINADKKLKGGTLSFPPQFEIEQLLLQGVADAFSDASLDIVNPESEIVVQAPVYSTPPGVAYAGARTAGLARGSAPLSKPFGTKMKIASGLMVLLLVAAAVKIYSAPADPMQVAVSRALASDPRARDEQIEITRQTLKEMGLDPGKNGDLGCLAAQ